MEKENVLVTEPHKILSIIRHTKTEFTFRVECDKDPDFGQFFIPRKRIAVQLKAPVQRDRFEAA